MITASWIALFAPAFAALLIGLLHRKITRTQAGGIAALGTLVSFISSLIAFVSLLHHAPEERGKISTLYTWLSAGDLQIGMDIFIDPLSIFMMLIVSGVGFLILTYSIGYMHGDTEERRYHAYKALFVFSMLLLVMAGNLLLLLGGWGMVGLSSYLLINYWHQRHSAIAAGKKAFVVNAFGDATFAISIFLLIQHVGAIDFPSVFSNAPSELGQSTTVSVIIALGLLGAAAAKSAQIPLHTWLPDAMEGPTPVSALIHAATMVTAGVYLIARTNVLFELAPAVLHTAAVLGGITLLVAGLIALVQTDIKRVIAYSTMSQIGYMFLAAGLGAYAAGMFHLMTHAFFKALLFMAAGVLIHALSDEQDIRKLRGLGSRMPLTHKAFLISAFALAGFPPLSGFFSKDIILAHALAEGVIGPILWVIGLIGALLTAVYTFRLLFILFAGKPSDHVLKNLHKTRFEGPLTMMLPVAALALLATFGGLIQIPGAWHAVDSWIEPVAKSLQHPAAWMEIASPIIAVSLALLGVGVAWKLWGTPTEVPDRLRTQYSKVFIALERKLYFDDFYERTLSIPTQQFATSLQRFIETPLVFGIGEELGNSVRGLGRLLSRAQNGMLRNYVLLIVGSLLITAIVFLSVR